MVRISISARLENSMITLVEVPDYEAGSRNDIGTT